MASDKRHTLTTLAVSLWKQGQKPPEPSAAAAGRTHCWSLQPLGELRQKEQLINKVLNALISARAKKDSDEKNNEAGQM